MESVDYWPMAITIHKTLEGKPKLVTVFGVTGGRYPSPKRRIQYTVKAFTGAAVLWTVF